MWTQLSSNSSCVEIVLSKKHTHSAGILADTVGPHTHTSEWQQMAGSVGFGVVFERKKVNAECLQKKNLHSHMFTNTHYDFHK